MSQPSDLPTRDALAITWESHRRTRELCAWLRLPLHELTFSGNRLRRYFLLGMATLNLLRRERPLVVYVQNPSLVLALIVLATRPFLGRYRVVMDAHNEAINPFTHAYWPITVLSRLAIRKADITIVTNEALATQTAAIGGRPHVLPDRLPSTPFEPRPVIFPSDSLQIMVVATYAADEPIAEIIEAARLVGPRFQFRITGRATKLPAEQRARLPANVLQTGFLSEEEYWRTMEDSHVMLDLTLKPDCLVCGAYEALAMRRPMLLTGNPATLSLFARVAAFPASHTAEDIAKALEEIDSRYVELAANVLEEAPRFSQNWLVRGSELRAQMEAWMSRPSASIQHQC